MNVRETLLRMRLAAGKSQSDVAAKLSAATSASRISRVESGDLTLSDQDARDHARAIGSAEALEFADYLGQKWSILERPGFEHVNREALWKAEQALQRLKRLEDDPALKNVLLKQVNSCRDGLVRLATFLRNTEHPIVLIGSPGVGKTTLVCALTGLRDERSESAKLEDQMALQTGGGRTTVGEVQVRCGHEYEIVVEAYSDEDMRQFVAEFCEHLLKSSVPETAGSREGAGLSSEVDRALRNMADLAVKRLKGADGKFRTEDPAKSLAKDFPKQEDLQTQIFARLEMHRRRRTSTRAPQDSSVPGLVWLARTSAEINYGHHPEFSLPRRVHVVVPLRILGEQKLDLRLIDTRGVDEPKTPRRDLQAYLDDETAIIGFCSSFKDAPDAAMLNVFEQANRGGLRADLAERSVFLVLPQGGEESKVRDQQGLMAGSMEDGRVIKEEQVLGTFERLGLPSLPVTFMDVTRVADCDRIRTELLTTVFALRSRAAQRLEALIGTVDHLIANRENEEVRATFEEVARRVQVWTDAHEAISEGDPHVERSLLTGIEEVRYPSSLRASVNRRGDWDNFDYWYQLGHGSRCEAVARTEEHVRDLRAVLQNLRGDDSLADAHGFIEHLLAELDVAVAGFNQEIEAIGETAYGTQLRGDDAYWQQCRTRWGQGQGYKSDIHTWTDMWFSVEGREERRRFIEGEIQRRWKILIEGIRARVAAASPAAVASTA